MDYANPMEGQKKQVLQVQAGKLAACMSLG
jgi:hypothetical protein